MPILINLVIFTVGMIISIKDREDFWRWYRTIDENGGAMADNYCLVNADTDRFDNNYDDLLQELKSETIDFPDISAGDLSIVLHGLYSHFCKPVVMCKDCNWYRDDLRKCSRNNFIYISPTDYCSFGQRK